ncbi:MAG: class 1 fructose-bisphosphatase [Propionivibrio sp.]|jgi:fructose-1,6-bisphosphatase I/sedoheptulose-1,7-bisphosphatase|nr:class 1 fructose-bisphosphatase [Propionivibrio sp.]MBK9029087.1 class 1 fructose-bisphosphatase [Propionivibrio sp.]
MLFGRTNINTYLVEERRRNPALTGEFSMLFSDVVRSCKAIGQVVSRGVLAGTSNEVGRHYPPGDTKKTLDLLSNQTFLKHCGWGGHLAAISSGEMEDIQLIPTDGEPSKYLLVFEPLDGASNIDVNLSIGSIFSVLRCPEGSHDPSAADFLQPGSCQLAAGYAIYGPSTMLVLTVGNGTHGFTLDRDIGEFLLTHPNLQIPAETRNFSINASNERFWEPPIRRYVEECLEGETGVREKDFNMRWVAAMVADVHRILMRGGVFMYPRDTKDLEKHGYLEHLHRANPMAMIVEQAGGLASTGYERIADVVPTGLHQELPVILGSRDEVERIERYHREFLSGEDKPFSSPLFAKRTLFRAD